MKTKIKIIMLDIDGVLNSYQSGYWYDTMLGHEKNDWINYRSKDTSEFSNYEKQLCPLACGNLRQLLEYHPDARIVVSSTWRKSREVAWFNRLFKYFKIFEEDKVIGKTPELNTERGYEIKYWLDNTSYIISNFVILDDDGDMGPYCGTKHFIQTDGRVGFDYRKMEEIDKIFSKFSIKRKDIQKGKLYKMYSKPRDTNYFLDDNVVSYTRDDGTICRNVTVFDDDLFSEVNS